MKITHGIEYALVRALAYVVQRLDDEEADWFGARLGRLGYYLAKSRVIVAQKNLEAAFGAEMNESRRIEVSRLVFENIGRTLTEIARFPLYTPEKIRSSMKLEGVNYIEEAAAHGKGIMVVCPHFGNWELIGAWMPAHGYVMSFLVGRQSNKFIDGLMNYWRRCVGVGVIEGGSSVRPILAALRRGESIGIVPDQHSAIGHVRAKFFGREIAAHKGPALFAYRTGAAIIPAYAVRFGPADHRGWAFEPIYADKTKSEESEVLRITQEILDIFEKGIRRYPEMWLWTHKRWKPLDPVSASAPEISNQS
ncbi:MAG: lysophospholipid acyltransferase family protein [candidate division Zixibacteria bacterium]|nr:lysophospholipid acyltransferase family protein [candidate division Zixibacteria bacterium]